MFQLSAAGAWLGELFFASAAGSTTTIIGTLLALLLAYFIYEYAGPPLHNKMKVFREMGVPYVPPLQARWRLESSYIFARESFVEMESKQIDKYGKVFGKFDMNRALLTIADPDLLRDVFVKEFNSFSNRYKAQAGLSKLFDRSLFYERNPRWREIRALVTPTFSSAKMRNMYGLILSCLQMMHRELDQRFAAAAQSAADEKKSSEVVVEIDAKDYFSNFAMDVLATVFFGVEVDAITNRNHPFVRHAFTIFNPSKTWRALLYMMTPVARLKTYMVSKGIVSIPLETRRYFETLIPQLVDERRKIPDSQRRKDFLNVLINARQKAVGNDALTATGSLFEKDTEEQPTNNNKIDEKSSDAAYSIAAKLKDEEIAGQIFIFIIAGFETTSTTMGFLFHELAMNQDVQDRLRSEISDTIQKHRRNDADVEKTEENDLTYDAIADMTYLDAIISETLRLYPTVARLERECMQDCTLSNGLQVKKGVVIGIPAWYIQRSAENFANPEKFDPERFHDSKRRAEIKPYTYMPFGQGPRNCVGMRFGLLELKMVAAFVVRNYRIVPTANTLHPPPLMQARAGTWMIRPGRTNVGLVKIERT